MMQLVLVVLVFIGIDMWRAQRKRDKIIDDEFDREMKRRDPSGYGGI